MKNKVPAGLDRVGLDKVKRKYQSVFSQCVTLIAASLLYGVSMNMFLKPGGTVLGGVTGISTTINMFLDMLPIGTMIIIINVPLVILNMRIFGFRAMIKTILGIFCTSIAVDLMGFLPVTFTDPLLCAIFGGACMGAGAGLIFSAGFTTGGSDIVAFMIRRKIKSISTGKIILILDLVVIVSSALLTRRYTGILYSLIASYAYTFAVDLVMGGADKAKLAFVVSPKYAAIADEVFNEMGRGVTVLNGRGWYTKEDKSVLMIVVKKGELYSVKRLIHNIDPSAFIILSDATEVVGIGFKNDI